MFSVLNTQYMSSTFNVKSYNFVIWSLYLVRLGKLFTESMTFQKWQYLDPYVENKQPSKQRSYAIDLHNYTPKTLTVHIFLILNSAVYFFAPY
uniref:Uncharacterized protein n=1 Tax=Lepeophtheirus salmonis TaxID=72036 RepID=A0A0K2TRC2_LEPSM